MRRSCDCGQRAIYELFKLSSHNLYMLHDDTPITATDVGYAAVVAAIVSGVALLVILVYTVVKNCRERDEDILRVALLENEV